MGNNYKVGYYSHSKRIYNTDAEKAEYDFLKTNFNGKIICPNQHSQKFVSKETFLDFINNVDYVFVTEFDGYLGKGSYEECAFALEKFIPVYLLLKRGEEMEFELVIDVIQVSKYNLFEYGKLVSKGVNQNQLPFLNHQ